MPKKKVSLVGLVPILMLVLLIVLFAVLTKGNSLTVYNIKAIIEQALPFILGGMGMIFVVAQGGSDLSQGSLLGVAALLSALAARYLGVWALFPVAILVGAASGLFSGILVAKFKVPSFMVTLSLLIALRAVVQLLLVDSTILATVSVMRLDSFWIKVPVVATLMAICWYLFERTRLGYYCKGMGENEMALISSGVNTTFYKTLGFLISGITAGIAGTFTIARVGGASAQLGNMFEMRVMMALYIGGISVTGGMSTKMYKLLIGAPIIAILENGLTLCEISGGMYELIEGVILIAVVAASLYFNARSVKRDEELALAALGDDDDERVPGEATT